MKKKPTKGAGTEETLKGEKSRVLNEIKKLREKSNESWKKLATLAFSPKDAKQIEKELNEFVMSSYLLISYPEILFKIEEAIQKLAKEERVKPSEFILRQFEKESCEILKGSGYPTDLNELNRQEKMGLLKVGMPTRWVMKVLSSIIPVRTAIKNNDAEKAAMGMMSLICAAIGAQRYGLDKREIKLKFLGPVMGGKADKKKHGIILAIKWALKDCRNKGARSLWRHLRRELGNEERTFGGFDIGFDEKKNCLFQIDRSGKDKEIHFRAFQNYVSAVKK